MDHLDQVRNLYWHTGAHSKINTTPNLLLLPHIFWMIWLCRFSYDHLSVYNFVLLPEKEKMKGWHPPQLVKHFEIASPLSFLELTVQAIYNIGKYSTTRSDEKNRIISRSTHIKFSKIKIGSPGSLLSESFVHLELLKLSLHSNINISLHISDVSYDLQEVTVFNLTFCLYHGLPDLAFFMHAAEICWRKTENYLWYLCSGARTMEYFKAPEWSDLRPSFCALIKW